MTNDNYRSDIDKKLIYFFFYTFSHLKRPFLYSKNYIKIIYYITLMNNEELIKENILLKEELEKTKNELIETKEHLKKYTAPIRNKIYYEENKEKHKQKVKEYKEKINYNATLTPEKKKEYARRAYLNKKEKLKKINENKDFENI